MGFITIHAIEKVDIDEDIFFKHIQVGKMHYMVTTSKSGGIHTTNITLDSLAALAHENPKPMVCARKIDKRKDIISNDDFKKYFKQQEFNFDRRR